MAKETYTKLADTLFALDEDGTKKLVEQALSDGLEPERIISEGLVPGMTAVGGAFERDEMFLPELLVAAMLFQESVNIVKPHLTKATETKGRVVMGTVVGDVHDIGKNVVCLFLETAGFEVVNLGKDVEIEQFAAAAVEHKADIVGASAMLTSTERQLKHVVEAVHKSDSGAKVMIGGAPVTEEVAEEYSADATAPDAAAAVRVAEGLMGGA